MINIHKNSEGSLILSALVRKSGAFGAFYFDMCYQGYTRKEALRKFKDSLNEKGLYLDK